LVGIDDDDLKSIRISKQVLPELPSDYEETNLGDKRGASKQYRNSNGHVREYNDSYTIHVDRADPRSDPLGHLLKDSPETIAAFATSLYFAKRSLQGDPSSRKYNKSGFGLLGFFSSFLILNGLFRWLKELLF
jgi:hypothetical protein